MKKKKAISTELDVHLDSQAENRGHTYCLLLGQSKTTNFQVMTAAVQLRLLDTAPGFVTLRRSCRPPPCSTACEMGMVHLMQQDHRVSTRSVALDYHTRLNALFSSPRPRGSPEDGVGAYNLRRSVARSISWTFPTPPRHDAPARGGKAFHWPGMVQGGWRPELLFPGAGGAGVGGFNWRRSGSV